MFLERKIVVLKAISDVTLIHQLILCIIDVSSPQYPDVLRHFWFRYAVESANKHI
ncbi:MAG: hypothetical protein QW083_01415 [Methanomassiliicoccales archaeon]